MTIAQTYLGVDIAKNWIDIFDPETNTARRVSTAPRQLAKFAKTLTGECVVFEASGGYERPLADALAVNNVAYVRVTGRLAKTDKVDAMVLAHMGAALCLRPTPHPEKCRADLADLVARREDIKAMMRAENNRLSQVRMACIKRDIRAVVGHLAKRLAKLETEIEGHIAVHDNLKQEARRLQTMPGIGPILSAALIANPPELGHLDRRQIASLCGLAPHARDSGLFKGKRRIWGGRAEVRRTLYLAAFIASRYDPTLRIFRKRLEAEGKPTKVALVACARKLVTILNAMLKYDVDYRKPCEM